MWRLIMTGLLYVVVVDSKPMDPPEGPLWFQDLSISLPVELFPRRNPDSHSQRDFQHNIYNPDSDYEQVPHIKRALTMFNRWAPISSFGKQRTPIRSNVNTLSFNQVGDRPKGQPLRWG